ncbi:rod shape-determining protein MreC [Tanticharoenia sakaeratensis NBRC 103193]|uniref:Cell shape-determining protein MreC n=1 Tax=Tanticharoenia sakaeratensis NBRC 103193 TaxID=1231623 RepID=A0A0D6MKK9_9PROT|nr:rod shape-determining protein MreC [Tanticharoenia sakaeratensis]GAN54177.1 rod shape-determining protein MreC [Tanticharoenia sakaeratensis NBRC 103193]GBQ19371.1 rod shape-determining protein MreC [Tanticharoenia sakaeratensis NBRC 103193]
MLWLSIQARQALGKLVLPALFVLAVGFVMLGFARRGWIDQARMTVADVLAPAYGLLVLPGEHVRAALTDLRGAADLSSENARLRRENDGLRRWYDVAVALANENAQLKAALNWIPDDAPAFVTGHAIRDAGGVYARAILLQVGPGHQGHVGDVALDAGGLIGRVTEIGGRTLRILLITDEASRIPVALSSSHGSAIMAGDNSALPRLIFFPQDNPPLEGERVTTGAQNGGLPQGLPVGRVHYRHAGDPVVVPDGDLGHLDIVRVFEYATRPVTEPEAPGRVPAGGTTRPTPGAPAAAPAPFGAIGPAGPRSGLLDGRYLPQRSLG